MSSYNSSLKRPSNGSIPGSPTKKQKSMDAPTIPPLSLTAKTPAMLALENKKKMVEEARARAVAVAAQLTAGTSTTTPQTYSKPSPVQPPMSDAQRRLADIKARVAAVVKGVPPPTTSTSPIPPPPSKPSLLEDDTDVLRDENRTRGGLDIGLHPALLADSTDLTGGSRGRQTMNPKYATTMANQRAEAGRRASFVPQRPNKQFDLSGPTTETNSAKNPYFDPKLSGAAVNQKGRVPKTLVFNQKGKFIEQANALRKQAQLEELKRRIAAAARRAGIEEEMDTDKLFLRDTPPDIEWWDQGLCTNSNYEDLENDAVKIDTPDSIITIYIQHPILLEPPMDKHIPNAKPLPLTKKEQKKTRLQARMASLKESQAKIRLGLEKAPPPKVTMKNMMRVWGDEAVKDPTAVEAKVNKQIAERMDQHLQANEERKLSKDDRLEKLQTNQEKDLAKGVHCLVFRVESLVNPSHQFKIYKNAEQLALTGICVHNPRFNLVVVEGGQWAVNKYKKLMMQRIKWDEIGDIEHSSGDDTTVEVIPVKGLENSNQCNLVWEGELKNRLFKKFTTNKCESEGEVRKLLERNKVENYWTLAKAKAPYSS